MKKKLKILLKFTLCINTSIIIESKSVMQTLDDAYQKYADIYKPLKTKSKSSKAVKSINFTPEDRFGGHQAQGFYDPKSQIAIILNGSTKYYFNKMVSHPTNPTIPDKKNLDEQTIRIGSFTTKKNHAGMPVTTYLFGVLTKTSLPKIKVPERLPQSMPSIPMPMAVIDNNFNNNDNQSQTTSPAAIGSNPATYAPITFYPTDAFAGDGLVGNYFASQAIATIHDPTQQNNQSYTFKQVQSGGMTEPEGLVLIGSYSSKPACSGIICSHAMMMTNLYGMLDNEDQNN